MVMGLQVGTLLHTQCQIDFRERDIHFEEYHKSSQDGHRRVLLWGQFVLEMCVRIKHWLSREAFPFTCHG